MMIRGDDGTWVKGARFPTLNVAEQAAQEYEAQYGNMTLALCSW